MGKVYAKAQSDFTKPNDDLNNWLLYEWADSLRDLENHWGDDCVIYLDDNIAISEAYDVYILVPD